MPRLISGSKPVDGGHLIFTGEERSELTRDYPAAAPFIRPFVGAREHIDGGDRWILALQDATPRMIANIPPIVALLKNVRECRLRNLPPRGKDEVRTPGQTSIDLAPTPSKFHVTVIPEKSFLVVPETSSENREYAPLGLLERPTIPNNLVRILEPAEDWQFGLLTSAMHMSWLRYIGGRLKSDYRYSIGLVYNTFPTSDMTDA